MDQPELEKEVRRLFRYDSEAIDVKWEVLTEDEKPLTDAGQTSGHIQSSGTVTNADGVLNDTSVAMDIGMICMPLFSFCFSIWVHVKKSQPSASQTLDTGCLLEASGEVFHNLHDNKLQLYLSVPSLLTLTLGPGDKGIRTAFHSYVFFQVMLHLLPHGCETAVWKQNN